VLCKLTSVLLHTKTLLPVVQVMIFLLQLCKYYAVLIMVICLDRGADLHMSQLMPLPLNVSCLNKIRICFTFPVTATQVVVDKGPLNGCVCVCVSTILPTLPC